MINHFSYDEARIAYDQLHPQPKLHNDGTPTIPMPGGVCSNRELDRIFRWSATIDEVVQFMHQAVGTPGMPQTYNH